MDKLEFIRQVLAIGDGFNDYGDLWESISWRTDGEYAPVSFFVGCNDVFYWGTADCDDLTEENLPLLIEAVKDVRRALGVPLTQLERNETHHFDKWYHAGSWAAMLFCARLRKMRPQRPVLKNLPEELKPLFLACGPERDPKSEG